MSECQEQHVKIIKEIQLHSISLVSIKTEIKSQYVANLLQIFPTNYRELPMKHKSDKGFNSADYI